MEYGHILPQRSKHKHKPNTNDKAAAWFNDHKTLHITRDAHAELLRYAGWLQSKSGEHVTTSIAIEELVKHVRGAMDNDQQ